MKSLSALRRGLLHIKDPGHRVRGKSTPEHSQDRNVVATERIISRE